MKPLFMAGLLVAALLSVVAPAHAADEQADAISRTEALKLATAAYREGLAALNPDERAQLRGNPDLQRQFALRLHSNAALTAQAVAQGLEQDPAIAARIARSRREVLIGAYMDKLLEEMDKPDLTTLARERYLATREDFRIPERRYVSHILLTDLGGLCTCNTKTAEQRIAEIAEELDAGADFAELATAESHDLRTKHKGGEIKGWIERSGDMPQAFEDAAFGLAQPGDVSEPIQTQHGWHLIRLRSVEATRIPDFEDVQARIEKQLWGELQAKALERARASNYPDPRTIDLDAIEALLADQLPADKERGE